MSVRAFEWHDLPALHRYRAQCIFLDSARVLTTGPIFVPTGALLSSLVPATGFYTAMHEDDQSGVPFFGQASHTAGASSAHLTFLTPAAALTQARLLPLVEHLLMPLGERGAMHLVAEVEEQSDIEHQLRTAGFGMYARQRIWRLEPVNVNGAAGEWRAAHRQDEAGVRFLYANLVPGLVQQVESLPVGRLQGLVYYRGNELLAYVDLTVGLNGLYAIPYIHPDAEVSAGQLVRLLQRMPSWNSRTVFLCVRSYQSWLEPVLGDLNAQPGQYQAVMVRRLAVRRMAPAHAAPALNGSANETSVPVARIEINRPGPLDLE